MDGEGKAYWYGTYYCTGELWAGVVPVQNSVSGKEYFPAATGAVLQVSREYKKHLQQVRRENYKYNGRISVRESGEKIQCRKTGMRITWSM